MKTSIIEKLNAKHVELAVNNELYREIAIAEKDAWDATVRLAGAATVLTAELTALTMETAACLTEAAVLGTQLAREYVPSKEELEEMLDSWFEDENEEEQEATA